jgi:hypothetical protein
MKDKGQETEEKKTGSRGTKDRDCRICRATEKGTLGHWIGVRDGERSMRERGQIMWDRVYKEDGRKGTGDRDERQGTEN